MNVMRGVATLGLSKMAEAPAPSKADDAKPGFELPDHDAMPAKRDAFAHARATEARPPASRDAVSADAHKDAAGDAAQPPQQDDAHPRTRADAATRRDGRGQHHDDTRDVAAESTGSRETPSETGVAADRHRATSTGDDAAALPDRMLALLSSAPLVSTADAPPAPATATSVVLPASTEATGIAPAIGAGASPFPLGTAIASTVPVIATALTGADVAADPALPVASSTAAPLPSTAAPPVQGAAMPGMTPAVATPALPASPTTVPSDAFAALAALADRPRDNAATADPATASIAPALGPVLARGVDMPQALARTAATAVAPSVPLMLDVDFDDGLGARVVWMAEQRVDQAQIRVSPDSLGPIDVRLQMDGHRVNAQFHAANADVRQALESGMDRLRDMLGRQGMELGQAQVGSGSRQGDGRGGDAPAFARRPGGDTAAEPQAMRVALPRSRGLLDEYA